LHGNGRTAGDNFSVSYILDAADLEQKLIIRSSSWGEYNAHMDFFVDSILITRSPESANITIDTRHVLYSLAGDESVQKLPADAPIYFEGGAYLRSAGEPNFRMKEFEGKKCLHIYNRTNDWDGIDIRMGELKLLRGNHYTIKVRGRVDGNAPENTQIMLQLVPGYVWRSNQPVTDNQEFELHHTLSAMEVINGETIRITTNGNGAVMAFYIYDIEITVKSLIR
jgi:hypothetical protein